MSNPVQIVAIVVSLSLLVLVIELVRRRKLTEEHSFLWIACALALLGLSIWRQSLDTVAAWLGVYYPPAVLLLVLVFFGFLSLLYVSVVMSRQRAEIDRLVEDLAVLEARLRDLDSKRSGPPDPV